MADDELIEKVYHLSELDDMAIAPERIDIELSDIKSLDLEYLARYVRKALHIGRFQNYKLPSGCGRSQMMAEWAYQVNRVTGKPVLIIAPLVVHRYFIHLGEKAGFKIACPKSSEQVIDGINVVNYEKLHKFDPAAFIGITAEAGHLFQATPNKKKFGKLRPFFEMPKYHFLTSHTRTLGIEYLAALVSKIYRKES